MNAAPDKKVLARTSRKHRLDLNVQMWISKVAMEILLPPGMMWVKVKCSVMNKGQRNHGAVVHQDPSVPRIDFFFFPLNNSMNERQQLQTQQRNPPHLQLHLKEIQRLQVHKRLIMSGVLK